MAQLLVLSAFVVVLGSALGVNEIIQLTNDEIHRVNVNVAAVREIYENAKALTLQPTYFYSKCLGPIANAFNYAVESEASKTLPESLQNIAAAINEQVDKYNEKLTDDKIDMTYFEFEVLQNTINDSINKLKDLRTIAQDQEQGQKIRSYCHDIYQNVLLIQSKGGLPATLQI